MTFAVVNETLLIYVIDSLQLAQGDDYGESGGYVLQNISKQRGVHQLFYSLEFLS